MALLDYAELQILELFKITIPSKLYYIVFNMNNLRQAVDAAKHMMTKEQINGQKTGQSSASPFMKVNQQSPKKCIL